MKVFIEYKNNNSFNKLIKHISVLFPDERYFDFEVILKNPINRLYVLRRLKRVYRVRPSLKLNVSNVTFYDTYLANRNERPISYSLVVNKKLTNLQKQNILRFKRLVKIYDNSGEQSNIEFYNSIKNVIYASKDRNTISEANYFHKGYFNSSIYECRHSSCIGKTLYIDKKLNAYFCPEHKEESLIGNIFAFKTNIEMFESNPNFEKVLDETFAKREECIKNKCNLYSKCFGGCPFEKMTCEEIKDNFAKYLLERQTIISNNQSLEELNIAKKDSILKESSHYIK